jgi:hypothetical protein
MLTRWHVNPFPLTPCLLAWTRNWLTCQRVNISRPKNFVNPRSKGLAPASPDSNFGVSRGISGACGSLCCLHCRSKMRSTQIAILRVWTAVSKQQSTPQQNPLLLSLTTPTGGAVEPSVASNARSIVDPRSKGKKNGKILCLCVGIRRLAKEFPTRNFHSCPYIY